MNSHANSGYLTLTEAAAVARCHVVTIRRYVRAGLLKVKRLQRRYRVSAAELEQFLAAEKRPGTAAVSRPDFPKRWLPLDDAEAKLLRGYRRVAKIAREVAGRHPAYVGVRGDEIVGFAVFDNARRLPKRAR
jgi:excisionase family DNA binding protein